MAILRKKVVHKNAELQMTSMIDCVFLLNSFFVIVTEYSKIDTSIELTMPKLYAAKPDENPDPTRLTINIQKDGAYVVMGEPRTEAWLKDALAIMARTKRDPKTGICDTPLLVRADVNTEFRHVRKLIMFCVDRHIKIWRMAFESGPLSDEEIKAGPSKGQ